MSALPFAQIQDSPEAIIVSNGNHLAVVAATRTSRETQEIERLPFDLPALEEEGVFINVDASGFGILDRRLDWEALGVELPQNTDVAFTPPRCVLLPNRFRRPLLTPVSQSHSALHKYSYQFRLTETLFESPAYRWVPGALSSDHACGRPTEVPSGEREGTIRLEPHHGAAPGPGSRAERQGRGIDPRHSGRGERA